ncbi:sodium-dependent glucose transporter 1-like [Oppia nitens]|uniref:sodium-dependent glucose transporter 1-like n=1 Tax=Oppia nitens TaxID=1686743 RepID=UPI0023DC5BD4|nr:sodium-dependent glucose transporter 1-like [Oppia nitens]
MNDQTDRKVIAKQSGVSGSLTPKYRIFLTIALVVSYLLYAFNNYIIGQTLKDLQDIYRCTYEQISNINTIRAFAYAVGSINGFAFDVINRQLSLMIIHVLIGLTMILTPFYHYLSLLYINNVVNGFLSGGIELLLNVWTVEMWAQDCGPYIQAVHFGGSVAGLITPQIFGSFLEEKIQKTLPNNTTGPAMDGQVTETIIIRPSTIHIPYGVLGGISVAFGLFIGCTYFYRKYERRVVVHNNNNNIKNTVDGKSNWRQRFTIVTCGQSSSESLMLAIVLLCGYIVSLALTIQWAQFTYIPTYVEDSKLKLSVDMAVEMSTVLGGALVAGRIAGMIISRFVNSKLIAILFLVILFVAEILYIIFTNIGPTGVWVANVVFGIGLGPMQAVGYQIVEMVTPVTNMIGVLYIFMSGLIAAITPIIMSRFIYTDVFTLVYVNLFFILTGLIVVAIVWWLIYKNNDNKSNYNMQTKANNFTKTDIVMVAPVVSILEVS